MTVQRKGVDRSKGLVKAEADRREELVQTQLKEEGGHARRINSLDNRATNKKKPERIVVPFMEDILLHRLQTLRDKTDVEFRSARLADSVALERPNRQTIEIVDLE